MELSQEPVAMGRRLLLFGAVYKQHLVQLSV